MKRTLWPVVFFLCFVCAGFSNTSAAKPPSSEQGGIPGQCITSMSTMELVNAHLNPESSHLTKELGDINLRNPLILYPVVVREYTNRK